MECRNRSKGSATYQWRLPLFTVDPAAQGGTREVNLVEADDGIGDRRAASGRADAATRGRRPFRPYGNHFVHVGTARNTSPTDLR